VMARPAASSRGICLLAVGTTNGLAV